MTTNISTVPENYIDPIMNWNASLNAMITIPITGMNTIIKLRILITSPASWLIHYGHSMYTTLWAKSSTQSCSRFKHRFGIRAAYIHESQSILCSNRDWYWCLLEFLYARNRLSCDKKTLQVDNNPLTHTPTPLDSMAAISQTIFSNAFTWMKSFVFWSKFHCSVFFNVQLAITQHWFR